MKDYYKILGISKNVSEEEIKKAYRRLAHQYHPDKKGGDEKKFKEINEAYQILGNKEKRAQYDRFGSGFSAQDGPASGWEDLFRQGGGFSEFSFDLGDIFETFFGGQTQGGFKSWITTELPITFTQAMLGDTIEVGTREGKVKITIPAGVQTGETLRLKGRNGDYIFIIKIKTPQKISKKAQDLLKELKNEGL